MTLGLPIVRTSPDHGTAFDIAGTGKADARSMIAAIRHGGGHGRCQKPVIDGCRRCAMSSPAHGLAAKKSLGQNFLLDLNLTARSPAPRAPESGGTFYEVGPGPGGLTRALLEEGAGKVIAVERDARCLPALEEIARGLARQARSDFRRRAGTGRSARSGRKECASPPTCPTMWALLF